MKGHEDSSSTSSTESDVADAWEIGLSGPVTNSFADLPTSKRNGISGTGKEQVSPFSDIEDISKLQNAVCKIDIRRFMSSSPASAQFRTRRLRVVKAAGCTFVNQYLIVQYLGRGASGRVFLAMDVHSNRLVAVKIVRKPSKRNPTSGLSRRPSLRVAAAKVASFKFKQKASASGEKHVVSDIKSSSEVAKSPLWRGAEPSTVSVAAHSPGPSDNGVKFSDKKMELKRPGKPRDLLTDLWQEIMVMRETGSHPNIVGLIEVVDDPQSQKMLIVMEYCDGGPVMTRAGMERRRQVPEHVARLYFRDMVAGLRHLHANKIIHGDLKPENALMTSAGRVVLSDFGCSKAFGRKMDHGFHGGSQHDVNDGTPPVDSMITLEGSEKRTALNITPTTERFGRISRDESRDGHEEIDSPDHCSKIKQGRENVSEDEDLIGRCNGTPAFLAPEMLRPGTRFRGTMADVYALGACLFCFIYGRIPFHASTVSELFKLVLSTELSFPKTPDVSAGLKALLASMLCKDPTQRVGLEYIANHPWTTDDGSLPPAGSCCCVHPLVDLRAYDGSGPCAVTECKGHDNVREEVIELLANQNDSKTKTLTYGKGQIIAEQGDSSGMLYYIVEGLVGVTYRTSIASKRVRIAPEEAVSGATQGDPEDPDEAQHPVISSDEDGDNDRSHASHDNAQARAHTLGSGFAESPFAGLRLTPLIPPTKLDFGPGKVAKAGVSGDFSNYVEHIDSLSASLMSNAFASNFGISGSTSKMTSNPYRDDSLLSIYDAFGAEKDINQSTSLASNAATYDGSSVATPLPSAQEGLRSKTRDFGNVSITSSECISPSGSHIAAESGVKAPTRQGSQQESRKDDRAGKINKPASVDVSSAVKDASERCAEESTPEKTKWFYSAAQWDAQVSRFHASKDALEEEHRLGRLSRLSSKGEDASPSGLIGLRGTHALQEYGNTEYDCEEPRYFSDVLIAASNADEKKKASALQPSLNEEKITDDARHQKDSNGEFKFGADENGDESGRDVQEHESMESNDPSDVRSSSVQTPSDEQPPNPMSPSYDANSLQGGGMRDGQSESQLSFSVFVADDLVSASQKAREMEEALRVQPGEYIIAMLGAGEFGGEAALIKGGDKYSFSLHALSDVVRVKAIPYATVRSFFKSNPVAKQRLAELVWERHSEATILEGLIRLSNSENELLSWEGDPSAVF